MKAQSLLYAAVAAIVCLSCTREAEGTTTLAEGIELEFTAAWADEKSTANAETDSRTVLQEDGTSIWWTANEEINAFFGSRFAGRFTSTNTSTVATAAFQGTLNVLIGTIEEEGDLSKYWAVYPYNANNTCDGHSVTLTVASEQTASAGTFADKFFPAVANSKTLELAFYNVCGGARFSVTQEGVTKVIFKSNDGSPMAGKVKVGFGDDDKPQILEITNPVDSVVVDAPEGGFVPGTNYFAAMLPQTHASGMSVTLYTSDKKADKSLSRSITVHRSSFGILDNLDEGLVYVNQYAVPEMVDLGLSVKWASFNIGASRPEEFGDYFAWGETEPKEDYSWSTYKWCNGSSSTMTKYCNNSSYGYNGFTDNKTVLDPEDDAATVALGGSWRMPTKTEQEELRNNCTWTWTTLNGVYGIKFTSIKPGYTDKWIFLPAAGVRDGSGLYFAGSFGIFWSSSLTTGEGYAYYVYFDSDDVLWSYGDRFYGQSVRPVYGDFIPVSSISFIKNSVVLSRGSSAQIPVSVSPSNASDKSVILRPSDYSVLMVSNGIVTAVSAGTATLTARSIDGGFTATCQIQVVDNIPVPEAVDLGLSVKWASSNLGATCPEQYGNYYAWGETMPKSNYSWSTYKFGTSSSGPFSKYNTNSSYGEVDNKTVLDLENDAAAVTLGGNWRMPTLSECQELLDNCTWTWTTQNSVKGRLVTGPNGNSIFLPAAGYRSGSGLNNAGSYGYYWSSSLLTDYPSYACYWNGYGMRYLGLSVRPVYDSSTTPEYGNPYSGGGEDW